MKKIAFALAAAALLSAQAFAQSPPGPTDGTSKSPQLPMGSAAKPGGAGEGTAAPAPMGADGTPKGMAHSKSDRKAASTERKAKMKAANKSGEIPSPSVNPKSY